MIRPTSSDDRRKRMRERWSIILVVSVLVIAGCGTDPFTLGSFNSSSFSIITADTSAQAQRVFELTNDQRLAAGLGPLIWNDKLAQAAEVHAKDMIDRNYFAHESPEGEDVGDRAAAAGYDWAWIGENLAKGQETPNQVVTDWMNSDGHREVLLHEKFTEIGISVRISISGSIHWVQVFGTRRPGI